MNQIQVTIPTETRDPRSGQWDRTSALFQLSEIEARLLVGRILEQLEPTEPQPDLRAYAVAAIAEKPGRIGYRMRFVSARNEDEAIGLALRTFAEGEPDHHFACPAALEVTADRLARLGVVLT